MLNTQPNNVLGIIAGSGSLPREVIELLQRKGQRFFVVAFENETDKDTVKNCPHDWFHLGKIGKAISRLQKEGVTQLVLVGRIARPQLSALSMDYAAFRLLVKLKKLRAQGDDAVFSAIIEFLEEHHFSVVGVNNVLPELMMPKGTLGSVKPDKVADNDIKMGMNVTREIGRLDIGQAAVIQRGQVLGVEGAEGTDKLIERCKELHQEGAGGVLVKTKKPTQDARVDLPSIGVHTIENAHRSGLRGIAVEAGTSLIIEREKVVEKANALGIFVVGV